MQSTEAEFLRKPLESNSFIQNFAKRFVAGEGISEAIAASKDLVKQEYLVTLAYLAENAKDSQTAQKNQSAYLELLTQIDENDLNQKVEFSIRPSQLGNKETASSHIFTIVTKAKQMAIAVIIEVDDGDDPDWIFDLTKTMHAEYPDCGFTLLSELKNATDQAKQLHSDQVRVRLTRGTYKTPDWRGYQKLIEIDRSYVQCLKALLQGEAKVIVATHDSRLIEIAGYLAADIQREPGTVEYQITFGMPMRNHERLLNFDEKVRVYLPFGPDWYPYLMRRITHAPESLFQTVKSYL
jgi:proline dehydrogenase